MRNIDKISQILATLNNKKDVRVFLGEVFTNSELEALDKRWEILSMLNNGATQREISSSLNVSLCKVTRGAKIMKEDKAIVKKYL